MADRTAELRAALAEAARLGVVGTGVDDAIVHARRFATALRSAGRVLDLGSGAGLPGLVLAADDPELEMVLLDASERRTDLLRRAVHRLGLVDHVDVVTSPAEIYGREPANREQFDAVVARAFGPPAVVAECAAPLLRLGGQLLVSEPPTDTIEVRWPSEPLAELGLQRDAPGPDRGIVSLTLVAPCPARFPRRRLTPPLFATPAASEASKGRHQ